MIVIIPCWRRPAHLRALLITIEHARLADEQQYIFAVDHDASPEIDEVISTFGYADRIAGVFYQGKHGFAGPAFNILRGWELGLSYAKPQEPIGLLEEDLLVSDDIFEFWVDALAAVPLGVGVSACRNQNQLEAQHRNSIGVEDAQQCIYLDVSYQSLAVALRRELIEEVLSHAGHYYFANPAGYVAQYLLDPNLPSAACSQDGLFHRVMRKHDLPLIYPVVPRACHVGWHGYNRPEGRPFHDHSNWRSDAQQILAMSVDQMNERADPRFRDIERCPLIRPRAKLKLV